MSITDPQRLEAIASQCVDSIDGCFADPISLFEAIQVAATKNSNLTIRGQDLVTSHLLTRTGPVPACSVEQLAAFVHELNSKVEINAIQIDPTTGRKLVFRYAIDFSFNPGRHEASTGGSTESISRLLRDGRAVIVSRSRVRYVSSLDDSEDHSYPRDEQVFLIEDDEVALDVVNTIRGGAPQRPR